jgi:hypothetical protein
MTNTIPSCLAHLDTFAGMPVPFIVEYVDGKPDFRKTDLDKLKRCIQFHLCGVCGKKLTLSCYWIGGPGSLISHYFTDHAMHLECAQWASKLCPFLSGRRWHYRGDLPTSNLHDNSGRPKRNFIMRGFTSAISLRPVGNDAALWAGKSLTVVEEF